MSRARSGFQAILVPFICQTTACRGQMSTQAPHFMQESNVSPRATDSFDRDRLGQAFWQTRQGLQRSLSILISKMLVLLKMDWNAPKGQKYAHCVRFFVRKGRTITSPAKSRTKIAFCTKPRVLRASTYSVTALKGQSQAQ